MSSYTPGMWRADSSGSQGFEINADIDGKWSAVGRVEPANKLGSRPVSEEEAEANALLILAAPDLLEACKMAYRSARVVHGDQSEVCVRLKKVIAKAERT